MADNRVKKVIADVATTSLAVPPVPDEILKDEETLAQLSIALLAYIISAKEPLVLSAPVCKDGLVDRTDVGAVATDVSCAIAPHLRVYDDYLTEDQIDLLKSEDDVNLQGLLGAGSAPLVDCAPDDIDLIAHEGVLDDVDEAEMAVCICIPSYNFTGWR